MREYPKQPTARELAREQRRAAAEPLERIQQIRMLLLLAIVALVFSIMRAGSHRVFTVGWLHLW